MLLDSEESDSECPSPRTSRTTDSKGSLLVHGDRRTTDINMEDWSGTKEGCGWTHTQRPEVLDLSMFNLVHSNRQTSLANLSGTGDLSRGGVIHFPHIDRRSSSNPKRLGKTRRMLW